MIDNIDTEDTNTTTKNVSDAEYAQFRAWKDSRIREAAIAEGRAQASAERMAEEQAADAAALQKLTSKGLSLKDAFGRASTTRGRDAITNLHRTSFASQSGAYMRLRRLAQSQGLVL
jgi:maltoporin